jgi:hypothetical protein
VRAFIVAVFDKSDRRVCRSADMIILRDRRFQDGHVRLPSRFELDPCYLDASMHLRH